MPEPFRIVALESRKRGLPVRKDSEFLVGNFPILNDCLKHMTGIVTRIRHDHPGNRPQERTRPMTQQLEAIAKSKQCSDLLMSDIRAAHTEACHKNPLLEILLRDLIADAVRLNRRLAEIQGGIQ